MDRLRHTPLIPLETVELPTEWNLTKEQGKVRDIFDTGNGTILLCATDRLSAFDRQVGLIPQRGQILTALSEQWFNQTADIVPNHMIEVIDPNIMAVRKIPRIDLEMVVRGYNTGSTITSIWKRYEGGQRIFGEMFHPAEGDRKQEIIKNVYDWLNR